VNTRREPGTRRQSRGTGGGLLLEKGAARAALRSTCRRKAFWIDQAAVIDVTVVEAVLGSSNEAGRKTGGGRGVTESASRSFTRLVRGRKRRGEVAVPKRDRPLGHPTRSAGAGIEGSKRTEAGVVPSSTPHSGSGRRKAGRHRGELGPPGPKSVVVDKGVSPRHSRTERSRVHVSEGGCRSR
jgi:hypothetical protein